MLKNITKIAKVVRTKNSGPFELTMDVIFKTRHYYELAKKKKFITKALIAKLYRVPVSKVMDPVYFEPANAVKVTIIRKIASGTFGDTDVYGAQQHAPLLGLSFNI